MANFVFHVVLLVCCAIHIQGKGSDKSDSSEIDDDWEKFKETNFLKYEDQTKEWNRKNNFAKAHRRIREHNRNKNATYKMAINQFATLNDTEFKDRFLLHFPGLKTRNSDLIYLSGKDLPETRQQPTSVDYRNHPCMQPVKKQGDCGDCWAYTATAVVEFSACIINNETKINLSEQQMTDCSFANFGCFGGYYDEAWKYVASAGYQATSASYPDTKYQSSCKFNKNTVKGAVISKTNQVIVIPRGDTTTMINLLNAKRLLAVSIIFVESFKYYGSGVYKEPKCDIRPVKAYHSFTIVGYGVTTDGIEYWVFKNSWSTSWGMNGYGLFQRGNNTCEIETYAATTTVIG